MSLKKNLRSLTTLVMIYLLLGGVFAIPYLPLGILWYGIGVLVTPLLAFLLFTYYEQPVTIKENGVVRWRDDYAFERSPWFWVVLAGALWPYCYVVEPSSWSLGYAAGLALLGIVYDQQRKRG